MSDYELRMIPAEDILPYRRLSSILFRAKVWNDGEDEETVIRKHREADAEQGEYFFRIGAYLDGTLYAAQEVLNYDIYFDGQPCRMSGIGGVVSDFNSPQKGALKQIYARSFEIMREQKQYISHLYGFEESYYRQYGYDVSTQCAKWRIPLDKTRFVRYGLVKGYDDSPEMQEDIRRVFLQFAKQHNLFTIRSGKNWENFLKSRSNYTTDHASFVHYTDGTPDAFFSYIAEPQGELTQNLAVTELWYTDLAALRGVLSYFETQRPYGDHLILPLPENVDLSPVLNNWAGWGKRNVERTICNTGVSRVVDAEEVLKMARYKGEGSVCIRIYDDIYAPWNNDCFTVTFGRETTVTRGGTPDIEMTINAFSSGILGRIDSENLPLFTDVKIHNAANLDKVFYQKPLWIEEHF